MTLYVVMCCLGIGQAPPGPGEVPARANRDIAAHSGGAAPPAGAAGGANDETTRD